MKKKQLERLKAISGVAIHGKTARLVVDGVERIGKGYDDLENQAMGPNPGQTTAKMLEQVSKKQNEMLNQLRPMIDSITQNKNDPRAATLNMLMQMMGNVPQGFANAETERPMSLFGADSEPAAKDSSPPGIEIEFEDDSEDLYQSVAWLSKNFASLMPGIVEAAKYAYSRLAEETRDGDWEAEYLVESPTEQDYLDRVKATSIEVFPGNGYILGFETPCGHLEEHGMYAVFRESQLLACGEYDEIADAQDELMGEE